MAPQIPNITAADGPLMNNPSIPTQQQQMAQANSMGMMHPGQMDMGPGGPNGPMMGQMRPHMNPMMMQMQSQQQQQHPMQMQGQRPPPPEYGKMMNHQVCKKNSRIISNLKIFLS